MRYRLRDDDTAETELIVDGEPSTLRTIEADIALAFVTGQKPDSRTMGHRFTCCADQRGGVHPPARARRAPLWELNGIVSDPEYDVEAGFVDANTRLPLAACIGAASKRWPAV